METSLFLAKFLGTYFIIIGLVLVLRREFFQRAISSFLDNPAIILWSGIFALIFGLLLLFMHPVFAWGWRGLITLFALFVIFKGLLRLFMPNKEKIWLGNWWQGKKVTYVGYIFILLGLYLAYHGFIAMA